MELRPRRFKTGLLLGAAFAAGLALGPASGLLGRHLGIEAALAQDSGRADTYRLLTLFGDVFERVRAEYVEPATDRHLIHTSSNAILAGLAPHINYSAATASRGMQRQTR